jgi:hypothetical protein
MYIINKNFGIGQVIETNSEVTKVYFEEVGKEKTLITSMVTFYNTLDEAEIALNPELSEEEMDATYSEMKAADEAFKKGAEMNNWLREQNAESAKKLMKNI